ncbi:MAG: hypothetical protein H6599_05825 [Flavobacteriales bacterium]|nr:hypothetical protein [Flavobacteriales bacterium]
MKKLISSISFAIILFSSFAQLPQTNKVEVTWGDAFKGKNTIYSEVLKTEGDQIYVLKFVKQQTIIEVFDKNLNSIREIEVSEEMKGEELTYEGLVAFQDNFIILGSFKDKKAKTNSLYYSTINKIGSQSNWVELVSMDYTQKRKAGGFSYDISQDSTKFMLYYNIPFENKEAPEKFGFLVLDEELKTIWQKDIELSYNESLFNVQNFEVDDNGNAYILGREYAAKEDRVKRAPNY